MGGNNSKSNLSWCQRSEDVAAASYLLDADREAPRPGRGRSVDQLLRIAALWDDGKSALTWTKADLAKASESNRWIQGFWAGVLVTDKGEESRCCLLIDLVAVYIFTLSSSIGCCSVAPSTVLRIPLKNLSSVKKLPATEFGVPISVTWSATTEYNASGQFSWRSTEENVTAALEHLYDSLQLLNHGEVPTIVCEWNVSLGHRMFPPAFYPAIAADDCFGLKFLILLLSKQTAQEVDQTPRYNIPPEWCATRPMLSTTIASTVDPILIQDRFIKGNFSVSGQVFQMLKHNALTKGIGTHVQLCIKDLHGPDYKVSANNLSTPVNGVFDGGVLWHVFNFPKEDDAILCNLEIAAAAISAAHFNRNFYKLSFSGCIFQSFQSHVHILSAMSALLCRNTTLNAIVFPPLVRMVSTTHQHGTFVAKKVSSTPPQQEWVQHYTSVWCAIGEAMIQNPSPKFVFLTMADCCMGDAGLEGLLRGLSRLFRASGLSPRILNFSGNFLTSSSVSKVCQLLTGDSNGRFANLSWLQEISFGDNPWCQAPDVEGMCNVIRQATSLQILDLSSSYGTFPLPQLRDALVESRCPLRVLIVGGYEVAPEFADIHAGAIASIAQSKIATMQKISMRNCNLGDQIMLKLMTSLPGIFIDYFPDTRSHSLQLVANSAIKGINFSKLSNVLQMSPAMLPVNLVSIDFSDSTFLGAHQFVNALGSCVAPMALSDLNVARSSFAENPIDLRALVEHSLLNPNIKLKSLDISGLRAGSIIMECLGYCLRKNRSLTSLNCEGQNCALSGWAAFRGCFYGNKKIVQLSVMWSDIYSYFGQQRKFVQENMAKAAQIKPTIGQAHRARQFAVKNSRIAEMVMYKKAFKAVEREMQKVSNLLTAIYGSVDNNAVSAHYNAEQKVASKLEKPNFTRDVESIRLKMVKQLGALHAALQIQRQIDSEKFVPFWQFAESTLSLGVRFFHPDSFNNFIVTLESLPDPLCPKLAAALNSTGTFVESLTQKATKHDYTIDVFLDILFDKIDPSLFSQYSKIVLSGEVKNGKKKIDKKKKKKKKNKDDNDEDDDFFNDDGSEPSSRSRSSASDGGNSDSGDGEGGGDGDGCEDDTDLVGDLYASCGPRDLPDGGEDGRYIDKLNDSALKRVALLHGDCNGIGNADTTKNCQGAAIALKSIRGLLEQMKSEWRKLIGDYIRANEATLMAPREFETSIRYLTVGDPVMDGACCLVTQCTIDRISQLEAQVRAWHGPTSVAMYVSTESSDSIVKALAAIKKFSDVLRGDASYKGSLIISLLFGVEGSMSGWDESYPGCACGPLYPINALRNVAAAAVTSLTAAVGVPPLIFLLDVDFVPSQNLHAWMKTTGVRQRCKEGDVFVIPAFENDVSVHNKVASNFRTKKDILEGLRSGSVSPFHVSYFPRGHAPTDYSRWEDMSFQEPQTYPVQYKDFYEPYVVMATQLFVPYDERFRGYGLNKCIHLKALSKLRDLRFHVLSGHFAIADTHARSSAHENTYGNGSGFRKYVIYEIYDKCIAELNIGIGPRVSNNTALLLDSPASPSRVAVEPSKLFKKMVSFVETKKLLEPTLLTTLNQA